VCATIADASDATTYSPAPTPIISGEPLRAATNVSGSFWQITAIAYAPVTSRKAPCTAASRSPS